MAHDDNSDDDVPDDDDDKHMHMRMHLQMHMHLHIYMHVWSIPAASSLLLLYFIPYRPENVAAPTSITKI